jgi:SET domain-containing protein
MLLIKTKIGSSKIHGIGLFAAEFIPKGTPTWRFKPGMDIALTQGEVDALPPLAKEAFKNYCYKSNRTDRYILCFDDARYFNHAENANCIEDPALMDDGEAGDVAGRDIAEGEEITNNYLVFDTDYV